MAGLKVAFLLFACSTLVMGFNIDNRIKRQATQTTNTGSESNDVTDITSSDNDVAATSSSDNELTAATSNSGSDSAQWSGASDAASNIASAMQSGAASDAASNISSGIQNAGERLQNAFNQTYQDERNSVSDSWDNVKKLIHQDIETKTNLTKTAFDLGTVFPKFGKNLIINRN